MNKYEVTLRVSTGGKKPRVVTRIEHAVHALDAVMQSTVNHSGDNESEIIERVLHVGPVLETAPEVSTLAKLLGAQFQRDHGLVNDEGKS
jgi:hypothetical protein